MNRSPSWRRRLDTSRQRQRQRQQQQQQEPMEDFGNAESVGGIAGDSTIGLNDNVGSTTKSLPQAMGFEVQVEADLSVMDTGDFDFPPSAHNTCISPNSSPARPPRHDPDKKDTKNKNNNKNNHNNTNVSYYEDDSVLLWSDDPEKEYFAYMLQQEQEHRAMQGKSAEDSLIGNSTIEEIQMHNQWRQHGGHMAEDPESNQDDSMMDDPYFPVRFPRTSTTEITGGGDAGSDDGGPESTLGYPPSTLGGPPSTFDGYSLATTEKSARIHFAPKLSKHRPHDHDNNNLSNDKSSRLQQQDEHGNFIFPDVIYVTDTDSKSAPPTPTTLSSRHSNDTPGSRRHYFTGRMGRVFFFVIALLCCVSLAAAGVAIYLSLAQRNDTNNTNSSSNSSNAASLADSSNNNSNNSSGVPLKENNDNDNADVFPLEPNMAPTNPPTAVLLDSGLLELTQQPTLGTGETPNTAPPTTTPPTVGPVVSNTVPPTAVPITEESTLRCGCPDCAPLLSQYADGFTCRERIDYLINALAVAEEDACRQVSGIEFPLACSNDQCNPDVCHRATVPTIMGAQTAPSQSPPPSLFRGVVTASPTSGRPSLRPSTSPPSRQEPTIQPTPRPTSLTLVQRGQNGRPASAFPLGRCEGDCDTDEDCADGLICFQRNPRDPVPGCLDGELNLSETDYCVPKVTVPVDPPTALPTTTTTTSSSSSTPQPPQNNGPTAEENIDDDFLARNTEDSASPTFSPTMTPSKDISAYEETVCWLLGRLC